MKIAIGMIVRNLISAHPLTDFLDNAEKYDHPIERVIVVYSHEADPEAIQELQRRTKVSLIRLQSYERAHMILKQLGVRFSSIQQLLFCPLIDTHGLIPYGFNRNHVLMEALFTGVDYLIFVDSDVQPSVLHRTPDGEVGFEEVDFIGAHLYGMSLGATITSSDYSGYNILPPASFEGMTALLWGLHKEDMAEFWQSSETHGGLIVQEAGTPELQPTTKVLGGNMGIRMSALTTLPPFFSPYYFYNILSLPADCFVRVERVRANNYNSFVPALYFIFILPTLLNLFYIFCFVFYETKIIVSHTFLVCHFLSKVFYFEFSAFCRKSFKFIVFLL